MYSDRSAWAKEAVGLAECTDVPELVAVAKARAEDASVLELQKFCGQIKYLISLQNAAQLDAIEAAMHLATDAQHEEMLAQLHGVLPKTEKILRKQHEKDQTSHDQQTAESLLA